MIVVLTIVGNAGESQYLLLLAVEETDQGQLAREGSLLSIREMAVYIPEISICVSQSGQCRLYLLLGQGAVRGGRVFVSCNDAVLE
jgi:hypothetical protein